MKALSILALLLSTSFAMPVAEDTPGPTAEPGESPCNVYFLVNGLQCREKCEGYGHCVFVRGGIFAMKCIC